MSDHTLNVTVTYPAAGKPFQAKQAAPDETLGSLKTRVLEFFDLKEGQEGGSQVTFVFFKGKERLENWALTLRALAGDAAALSLKLSQQIVQGA